MHSIESMWIPMNSASFISVDSGGFWWIPLDSGGFPWGGLRGGPVDSNGMCLIHSGRFCNTYSRIVNTAEVLVASLTPSRL